MADNVGMYRDPFLTELWLWALRRGSLELLVYTLDTLPSRYGPRVRA